MSEPFHKTRGPKMAGIDLSKAKLAVLADANRKGFGVELVEGRVLVARRDRGTSRVVRGILILADGSAVDAASLDTTPLSSAAAWRRCLGF